MKALLTAILFSLPAFATMDLNFTLERSISPFKPGLHVTTRRMLQLEKEQILTGEHEGTRVQLNVRATLLRSGRVETRYLVSLDGTGVGEGILETPNFETHKNLGRVFFEFTKDGFYYSVETWATFSEEMVVANYEELRARVYSARMISKRLGIEIANEDLLEDKENYLNWKSYAHTYHLLNHPLEWVSRAMQEKGQPEERLETQIHYEFRSDSTVEAYSSQAATWSPLDPKLIDQVQIRSQLFGSSDWRAEFSVK